MTRSVYTGQPSAQEDLFNHARSRVSDPSTSRAAAQRMERSGAIGQQAAEVLRELRRYLEAWGQAPTSRELAAAAVLDRHMVARRLPELERAGEVVRAGKRTCREGQGQALTWEVTSCR